MIEEYRYLTLPSFLKVGRGGENVYLEHSLYEKESELIIFFLMIACVRGKAPLKVNLNGIRNTIAIEIGFLVNCKTVS